MAAQNNKALKIALAVGASFMALVVLILYLAVRAVITPEMAMLMFVAMLGLYFGFGVLIAVYRFMSKLQ